MKKQTPDEFEQIQQAILEREIEEELQRERLINFWKNYRFLIIGGVIAIILSVAGTEFYHSWRNKIRSQESNSFESAVVLNAQGKKEEALSTLNQLAQNAKTSYKYLAKLKIAGINLANQNVADGLQKLKQVADDKNAPSSLKSIALLSYVGHQVDNKDPNELLEMLSPLLNTQSEYFASATELKVALLLKQNNVEEAKKTLQNAVLNPNLTPVVIDRLKSLLSAI